jgi:hypothetical protein
VALPTSTTGESHIARETETVDEARCSTDRQDKAEERPHRCPAARAHGFTGAPAS